MIANEFLCNAYLMAGRPSGRIGLNGNIRASGRSWRGRMKSSAWQTAARFVRGVIPGWGGRGLGRYYAGAIGGERPQH